MRHTSLYVRVSAGFLAILLLGAGLIAYSLRQSSDQGRIVEEIISVQVARVEALEEMNAGVLTWTNGLRGYALGGPDRLVAEGRAGRAQTLRLMASLDKISKDPGDPEDNARLRRLIDDLDAAASRVLALREGGDAKAAFDYLQRKLTPVRDQLSSSLVSLRTEENRQIQSNLADYRQRGALREETMRWGILASLMLALGLAYATARAVVRPVRHLADLSATVAAGDYTSAAAFQAAAEEEHGSEGATSRNEVERLASAFAVMIGAIKVREDELHALADIRAVCLSTNHLEPLLEAILPRLAFHTGSDSALAYMIDPMGELNPVAGYAVTPDLLERSLSMGEGLPGQAARERRRLITERIPEDTRFLIRPGIGTALPRAMICAPLMVQDQLLGVVCLASLERYDEAALRFLDRAIGQTSIAVSNAVAFGQVNELAGVLQEQNAKLDSQNEELQTQNEELQAQGEELQAQNEEIRTQQEELTVMNETLETTNRNLLALQSISSAALSSMEMDDLLQTVLESVGHAMDAFMGSVFLLEEDGITLAHRAWYGYAPEDASRLNLKIGQGFAGMVARRREAEQLTDLKGRQMATSWLVEKYGTETILAVPLISQGELLGVIEVFSKTKRYYDAEEIDLLQAAAGRISTAIDRARAFDLARSERVRLQVILDRMPEGVIVASAPDGKLDFVNRAAEEMCAGVDYDALIARHPEAFGFRRPNGELFAADELPIGRSILFGEEVRGEEIVIRHDDGGELTVLADCAPIGGSDGKVASAVMVFQNVTRLTESRDQFGRIAGTLQSSLLPEVSQCLDGCQIAHFYKGGSIGMEVGGDFYDVFALGDGRLGIVIGDVSGKGLDAAVKTAMVKYSLRSYASEDPSPGEVLRRVNDNICKQDGFQGFITLFYGVVDSKAGTLVFANAGHEPPLLVRHGKSADELFRAGSIGGTVLGVEAGIPYTQHDAALAKGDALLLFTDGLTEARKGTEMLCSGGLRKLLDSALGSSVSLKDAAQRIYADALEFADGHLRDDVAMLLVRIDGGV